MKPPDTQTQLNELTLVLEGVINHVKALTEVQHIIFLGLIAQSPAMKEHLAAVVREAMDYAKDNPLEEATIQILERFAAYANESDPSARKDRFRPYLAWSRPTAPTPGKTADDHQ